MVRKLFVTTPFSLLSYLLTDLTGSVVIIYATMPYHFIKQGAFMIDFSPIPDLHVHVTMGDVLCCNGCACCCSESSSDITFQKQGGGAIHVDPNTVYVLDTKGGGLNL